MRDFIKRFRIALRVAIRTFMIRLFGQYVHSEYDGRADFVVVRYNGNVYYTPTRYDTDAIPGGYDE
jgi:hypothetical protein